MRLRGKLKDQRGQALIESILTAALTVASFSVLLMMGYRGLVYFTARHSVNELLFCLSSIKPQSACESDFKQKTQAFLIFKESSELTIKKNASGIVVSFQVRAPATPPMLLERKLLQPLERNI